MSAGMSQRDRDSQVVLGTAVGLTRDQIMPFLVSLQRTGYRGRTVLFVDRALRRQLQTECAAHRTTLIPIAHWLPFKLGLWRHRRFMRWLWSPLQTAVWTLSRALNLIPGPLLQLVREQLACLVYPPMDTRFIRYKRFLTTHSHREVLLTDVRDVLFQADPFGRRPLPGLAVSIETTQYTIGTEHHNARWLRRAYGEQVLQLLADRKVSCVGVTYGDRDRVLAYLRSFVEELLHLPPAAIGVGGADTAIHNKLIWTGAVGQVQLLEPLDSIVATLNAIDPSELHVDPSGKLVNRDGSVVSIVHQYDRQATLHAPLLRALTS